MIGVDELPSDLFLPIFLNGLACSTGVKLLKRVAIFLVSTCHVLFAVDANEIRYCASESAGSMKKDKADCNAQYAAAVKDAGIDKEERKLAAAELAECLKQVKTRRKIRINACGDSPGY
jgi:hypothetical protein